MYSKAKSLEDLIKIVGSIPIDFSEGEDVLRNIEFPTKILQPVKNKMNRAISPYTTNSSNKSKHFDHIPVEEINEVLSQFGYILINEDATPYSAILTGTQGRDVIELGATSVDGSTIKPVSNSVLVLSWYNITEDSLRPSFEITAYVS